MGNHLPDLVTRAYLRGMDMCSQFFVNPGIFHTERYALDVSNHFAWSDSDRQIVDIAGSLYRKSSFVGSIMVVPS